MVLRSGHMALQIISSRPRYVGYLVLNNVHRVSVSTSSHSCRSRRPERVPVPGTFPVRAALKKVPFQTTTFQPLRRL